MTTENLRREARVDVRVPVTLLRGKKTELRWTSDVSFKGLFVCTTDPPPLRSLVRLKVALPDRELEVHAMAVHVVLASSHDEDRAPGVGLQFWGLSGLDRTLWDDFVRGLVHARRILVQRKAPAAQTTSAAQTPAAQAPEQAHPALSEPATPSGIHMRVTTPRASSK